MKLIEMVLRMKKITKIRESRGEIHRDFSQNIDPDFFSIVDPYSFQANVGGPVQRPIWVFGVVDTAFTPARGYMEIVSRRDRATLAGILNRAIAPNTELHTDEWRGYLNLDFHVPAVFSHDTVNHTYGFVNPVTGTHTQVS